MIYTNQIIALVPSESLNYIHGTNDPCSTSQSYLPPCPPTNPLENRTRHASEKEREAMLQIKDAICYNSCFRCIYMSKRININMYKRSSGPFEKRMPIKQCTSSPKILIHQIMHLFDQTNYVTSEGGMEG